MNKGMDVQLLQQEQITQIQLLLKVILSFIIGNHKVSKELHFVIIVISLYGELQNKDISVLVVRQLHIPDV